MNEINVLDCTLRDGGYVNDWQFGKNNIKKMIQKLSEAKIDIIECGFLTEKKVWNPDISQFDTISRIQEYLPEKRDNILRVCMVNYGEYDINNIPDYTEKSIDGIRVAFHKKDMNSALEFCKKISQKGYKLFIQPMVSVSYTDEEYIQLIQNANNMNPHAFYIVDSFGVMKRNDLFRLYYLVDHNLNHDIYVGYHSHNNIQMAYSNAQALVEMKTKRNLIIDASVFGMGRGAGNLNTELFIEHLNEINGARYKVQPLLQIIDQILAPVYLNNFWGYSLPHYISAVNNCHPNYASYLDAKNTLTIENINEILSGLNESEKNNFDIDIIEHLYHQYQERTILDEKTRKKLKKVFKGKTAILIAPGTSIVEEEEKVRKAIQKPDTITVSINFRPENLKCHYTFVSNLRRFEDLKDIPETELIKTSNIQNNENGTYGAYTVNYADLRNNIKGVEDNATMMLIKLLIDLEVKKIKLAGLDGYSHEVYENFAQKDMAFIKSPSVMDTMNQGMETILKEFSKHIKIEFITTQKYVRQK